MTRYLITTADERTWKFDRPVLFLGEWCRRYNRRHVWEGMDAVVADPYGVEASQRIRDLHRVGELIDRVAPIVSRALNAVHQTKHTERYWRIVAGHWLWRAVSVLFNRFHVIEQALDRHDVGATAALENRGLCLASPDSLGFIYSTNRDDWNNMLFTRMLADRGDVPIETVLLADEGSFVSSGVAEQPQRENGVKAAISRLAGRFVRDSDAVTVKTYLSARSEIALQLSLGQVPQWWRWPEFERVPRNPTLRSRMVLDHEAETGFERSLLRYLPELMPTCYLEGYDALRRVAEALPWPARPKFVFTSNCFDTDEVFKVWTASKVEQGTPYFTGQHGANYGTRAGTEYWPERNTPDAFLTWGWHEDDGISHPAFLFPRFGKKGRRHDREGGVVLVEDSCYHACYPSDRYYDYGLYQEEQFRFVEALPPLIHQRLTVRLHGGFRKTPWHDDQRWRDRRAETRLDFGVQPISRLIAQSRLVIYSYDSTGLLEALAANTPVMCFWRNCLDHLVPAAKPYYERLRRAGILYDSAEEAARAVAERWTDIDTWWQSREVQEARAEFSGRYARREKRRVLTMRRLLRERAAAVLIRQQPARTEHRDRCV